MPSPVGHLLAGTAVYVAGTNNENRSKLTLGVVLLGSIFPDFDFLPGILIGAPAVFHRGISHSFGFALLFGLVVYFVLLPFQKNSMVRWTATLAALAYASHVVLDAISVNEGARNMPIFWPLSGHQFGFNIHLFGHFHHGALTNGIWSVVRRDNVPALLRETTALGILVLLLFVWREKANVGKVVRTRR